MDETEQIDQSEDQTEKRRWRVMRTYYALADEVRHVRDVMSVLAQLFGDKRTLKLWKAACPYGMRVVQLSLNREMILTVCRLCDRAWFNAKTPVENCTFPRLIELVGGDGRRELADRIGGHLERVKPILARFVEIRHKRLGHLDHDTVVRRISPRVLNVRDCNEVVAAMRRSLEEVHEAYQFGPMFVPEPSYEGEHLGNLLELPRGGFAPLVAILREVEAGRLPEWPQAEPDWFQDDLEEE